LLFCLACVPARADTDPGRYDRTIRKEAHMDDGWFDCETDKDCTVAHIPCQAGIAVAKKFKSAAEGAVCRIENCYQGCDGTTIDNSSAACEEGECVTRFGHGKP
jgi:hypothetical protein